MRNQWMCVSYFLTLLARDVNKLNYATRWCVSIIFQFLSPSISLRSVVLLVLLTFLSPPLAIATNPPVVFIVALHEEKIIWFYEIREAAEFKTMRNFLTESVFYDTYVCMIHREGLFIRCVKIYIEIPQNLTIHHPLNNFLACFVASLHKHKIGWERRKYRAYAFLWWVESNIWMNFHIFKLLFYDQTWKEWKNFIDSNKSECNMCPHPPDSNQIE